MAEGGRSERESLGSFSGGHRKYGSTAQVKQTNETYMKHYVKPGETLQGIALKYGKTMADIKRVNNMWTNDSLFLRDFLLIPLCSSPMLPNRPLTNGDPSSPDAEIPQAEIVTQQELRAMSRSASKDKSLNTAAELPENDLNAKDFLSKFDTSLARLKSDVQRLDASSNFPEDTTNPLNYLPQRRSSRYSSLKSRNSTEDVHLEPDLVFKSNSTSRRIRSSLEQIEKAQDDIFQL